MNSWQTIGVAVGILAAGLGICAERSVCQEKNSATFDGDGTAHITRVIRPAATVSPEAQKWLESLNHRGPGAKNLAERRAGRMRGERRNRPWRKNFFR